MKCRNPLIRVAVVLLLPALIGTAMMLNASPMSKVANAAPIRNATQKTEIAMGASQTQDGLFIDVPSVKSPLAQSDPTIRRGRLVEVRFDQFGELRSAQTYTESVAGISKQLTLNLFNDVTVVAQSDQLVRNQSGSYSWIGHLNGIQLSQVVLTVHGNIMYGSVNSPEGVFEISSIGNGTHVIYEINQTSFGGDSISPVAASPNEPLSVASPTTDDGGVIDVLVAYTDDARQGALGRAQIEALIDTAVNGTNSSYTNSGINQRVRLVGMVEVNYAETAVAETDANNLRNGSAGLQIVRDLRNAYAADLVTLIVNQLDTTPTTITCGRVFEVMGSVTASFEANAYNVTRRSCAVNNLAFAHELGHLMGARHDWYVDDTNNRPYSYNHGYVNVAGRWGTIMAYGDRCSDQTPSVNCTTIAFWSNPDISRNGAPLGIAAGTSTGCTAGNLNNPNCDADNRSTLNNTAVTVSNFRAGNLANPTVNPSCNGSNNCFRTVTEAVFRAAPGSTITISPGNYPEALVLVNKDPRGLLIDRPVTLRSDGTVVIGQ